MIDYEVIDHIAYIRLNRPEKLKRASGSARTRNPAALPGQDDGFLGVLGGRGLPCAAALAGRAGQGVRFPLLTAAHGHVPVLLADHGARRGRQLPQVVEQLVQHVPAQRVVVVPARLADADQARVVEDLGVVGDRRLGDGQRVLEREARQFVDRCHLHDDAPPDRVAEGLEDLGRWLRRGVHGDGSWPGGGNPPAMLRKADYFHNYHRACGYDARYRTRANDCRGPRGVLEWGYFERTRGRPKTRSATISRMISV